MKKFLSLIWLLLIITALNSEAKKIKQSDDEINTIFKGIESGFYAAPEIKLSTFNSEFAAIAGFRAGWIINRKFTIGPSFYGVVTEHSIFNYLHGDTTIDTANIRLLWGGLTMEYIMFPKSKIHPVAGLNVGYGMAMVTRTMEMMQGNNGDNDKGWNYASDGCFVIEPSLGLEFNLIKIMRAELGVSYRIVSGADIPNVETSKFGGFSGHLALKFGLF